jgi:hypothetical protein
MSWFKRTPKIEPIVLAPPASSRVEVELHKNASEEAAKKAAQTNQHLNDLLVENGFTLKIFLAAGGHLPTKKTKAPEK